MWRKILSPYRITISIYRESFPCGMRLTKIPSFPSRPRRQLNMYLRLRIAYESGGRDSLFARMLMRCRRFESHWL